MNKNDLIERLIRFYSLIKQPELSPIWQSIVAESHARLRKGLQEWDTQAVESELEHIGSNGCYHGIGGNKEQCRIRELLMQIGAINYHNPEQDGPWPSSAKPPQNLESLICEYVGLEPATITYVRGLCDMTNGLDANHGHINPRVFQYVEMIYDIKHFWGRVPTRIIEIGAGLGILGGLFIRNTSGTYETFDLPTVSVIQAFLLGRLLKDDIWLAGEDGYEKKRIRVHGPLSRLRLWSQQDASRCCIFTEQITGPDTIIVNQDSFPEFTRLQQDLCLEFIDRNLQPGEIFYSCNQESPSKGQRSIHQAIKEYHKLDLVSRSFSIVRPGYVKEIYRRSI